MTRIDHGANPVSNVRFLVLDSLRRIVQRIGRGGMNLRSSSSCEETYGFMPYTATVVGNLFLMAVYGYLLFVSASLLSDGSEFLLGVTGSGIMGG
jgi:hypothetical protein